MFSFIPSWYGKEGSWLREPEVWYRAGAQMEFDDAVNQIRIFQMAGEESEVILLSCMPDLRHFLHREGIDSVRVWSAFDRIQNIRGGLPRQMRLRDYDWPEDLEWSYTPFLMLGYLKGRLYVSAGFSEDGWWTSATFYERDLPVRKIHLDDRGFISCAEEYRMGEPVWRLYFDRQGIWQIREDLKRRNVFVNPAFSYRFGRSSYAGMEELIEEVLSQYLKEKKEDHLIAAFDERHNEIVRRAAAGRKTAWSVFSQRTADPAPSLLDRCIRGSSLVVTDTEDLSSRIREAHPAYAGKVMDISPYDARLTLGGSTGIRELKILLYLDSDRLKGFEEVLARIFSYMEENGKAFLTLGIGRHTAEGLSPDLAKAWIQGFMEVSGAGFGIEGARTDIAENETEEEEEPSIAVRECRTETQIIEVLSDHRIIIDLSGEPDLYLQIAGISAGLPMILGRESRYVSHRENGWILSGTDELEEALRFYLDGLSAWNQSLIWSLRRIGEYTGGHIVGRWKKVLEDPGEE